MITFKGYFENSVWRLKRIHNAIQSGMLLFDKMKLVAKELLEFCPRTLRKIYGVECWINRLMPDMRDVTVEIDGARYILFDNESYEIICENFESFMPNCLKIRKGEIFVDVGANIGKYAIPASGIAKLVLAIEACPETFSYLEKNIAINGLENVIPINCAAWNEDTLIQLYFGDVSGQSSVKFPVTKRSVTVRAEKLNTTLTRLGIERVNWIKIDVEGAELEVLEGTKETLMRYRPKIVVEVWDANKQRLFEFMEGLGYKCRCVSKGDNMGYYFCSCS
jgi:FkbM family methyltransferase